MATVQFSDLANRALIQVARSDSQATTWAQNAVADAVRDLCSGGNEVYFEELEVVGPNFDFVADEDEYAITDTAGTTGGYTNGVWLTTGDELTSIMDMIVWTDAAPTNTSATNRSWITIQDVPYQRQDRISPTSTNWPTQRSRRGSAYSGSTTTAKSLPVLIFRNVPNDTWTSYMIYRKMHPFTGVYPYSTTGLILPSEWEKVIVDLATAILWNGPLKEHDRAQAMFMQLGKGTDEQGHCVPGIIQALGAKRQREYSNTDQHVEYRLESNCPW